LEKERQARNLIIIIAIGSALLIVGCLGILPVNRPNVSFTDARDLPNDPDFDIISMSASQVGEYYLVEMTVAGNIQYSGRYVIDVVADMNGNRHIYGMEVSNAHDESYGAQVVESGSTLSVYFPLEKLLPGAVIIGLEGVSWGAGFNPDYANEMDRDSLPVHTFLTLPFSSWILLIPGACIFTYGMVMLHRARNLTRLV